MGNNNTSLLFVGDIAPVIRPEHDNNRYKETTYSIGNELYNIMKDKIVFGNLETTITNKIDHPLDDKNVIYRTENRKIDSFFSLFDHVSIANDHILDYRKEGMVDTIHYLRMRNIKYTGAGKNIDKAMQFKIIEINKKRIAIFSAADHPKEWMSDKNKYGIFYLPSSSHEEQCWTLGIIQKMIEKIKKYNVDLIIFSYHYGYNYQTDISHIRPFFHDIIKLGINVIHGHSAHHINIIDRLHIKKHKGIIIYANGDFINDYGFSLNKDSEYRMNLTMAVEVKLFSDNDWDVIIYPLKIYYDYKDSYYGRICCAETNVTFDKKEINWIKSISKNGFQRKIK